MFFSNSVSEDMTSETDLETQPLLLLFEVGEAKSSKITALSFSLSLSKMDVSVTSVPVAVAVVVVVAVVGTEAIVVAASSEELFLLVPVRAFGMATGFFTPLVLLLFSD